MPVPAHEQARRPQAALIENHGFVTDMALSKDGNALDATIELYGEDAPKLAASNHCSIYADPGEVCKSRPLSGRSTLTSGSNCSRSSRAAGPVRIALSNAAANATFEQTLAILATNRPTQGESAVCRSSTIR